ncbi:MAG TPA: glycosyltransferase family 1 protein [Candidatus Aphodovivens avicola]|nr:glycosyltransferase family 1 protein [Candidatus Aphodovivens avicola]
MREPIRVAHIMGKMLGGGVEQVVMNYYRHIDRSRVQFDFLVDADSTLVPREEIKSLGGRVFEIPPYQHLFAYQRALISLFNEQGWRIVHSHVNALSVFPLRAAKKAGVPVRIAHSHSTAGKGEHTKNAIKGILRCFSNVYPTYRMACSNHAGRWLFGANTDFEILHNAIDISSFEFDPDTRRKLRKSLGIASDALVIGHIGRFVNQKNHAFLVDVLKAVTELKKDAVLVLVGDGPLVGEVKAKAKHLNLTDSVLFLGQREDASDLYQVFDVFCLPSYYEGLGMVAIEAQAAGLPTICSEFVPDEALVSSIASKIYLSDGPTAWAIGVVEASCAVRYGQTCSIVEAGYDICSEAKRLESDYLQLASAHFVFGPSEEMTA